MYTAKHHPEASPALLELSPLGMRALVALLEGGQASGEVGPGSAEEHALVAFAAIHGVATLATDDLLNGVPWQEAAHATVSFVWRGCRPDPNASTERTRTTPAATRRAGAPRGTRAGSRAARAPAPSCRGRAP